MRASRTTFVPTRRGEFLHRFCAETTPTLRRGHRLLKAEQAALANDSSFLTRHRALGDKIAKLEEEVLNQVTRSGQRAAREGAETSRSVQALQKKIDRPDGTELWGTDKSQGAADNLIKEILGDAKSSTTRQQRSHSGVDTITDIVDSKGRAVRIRNGEFDTFLNPSDGLGAR